MSREYENHLVSRLMQDAERRRIDREAIMRKKAEDEMVEVRIRKILKNIKVVTILQRLIIIIKCIKTHFFY